MRMIIPCAGLGTRMNMKNDESKELLLHNGEPLIEYALDLAAHFEIKPLVITRIEKKDLIQYCEVRGIEVMLIEPEGEWANTVLKSAPWWDEDNILVLPDTIFSPKYDTILDIMNSLKLGNNAVFALHQVTECHKWGIIENGTVTEKPISDDIYTTQGFAWGLIGFKKSYGKELFLSMTKKNNPLKLTNCGFTYLAEFKDLTRNGKIG